MPSPCKRPKLEAIARLLGFGCKAKRDSPLVLQTGFPTSVADLLVKNRSRMRKPGGRLRKSHPASPDDAACSTMATLASEILAASAPDRPPSASPGSVPPENVEARVGTEAPRKDTGLDGFARSMLWGSDDLGVPESSGFDLRAESGEFFQGTVPSKVPTAEAPQRPPVADECKSGQPPPQWEAQRRRIGEEMGEELLAVVKVVLVVVVLAIVSKKIAVMVSGLAFAFLLAESIGRRVISLMGPCEGTRRSFVSVAARVPVSEPTRSPPRADSDPKAGPRVPIMLPCIVDAEGPVDGAAVAAAAGADSKEEKRRHDEVEGNQGAAATGNNKKKKQKKKKKKRLFGKLVPTRFLGGKSTTVKGVKTTAAAAADQTERRPASDSGDGGSSSSGSKDTSSEEALEEDDEEGEDGQPGAEDWKADGGGGGGCTLNVRGINPTMVHELPGEEAAAAVTAPEKGAEAVEPAKTGGSEHLVFFVVVLCGLIGGRMLALALTVLWYLLAASAGSLWRRSRNWGRRWPASSAASEDLF